MQKLIGILGRVSCALICVAGSAFAADYYVDAIHGSDANGGSSVFDAWQTLTHAIATIPATPFDPHTIHVAPGTYDNALGELFPLVMRPGMRLVGAAGSAVTILAGPAPTLVQFKNLGPDTGSFDATSGADGLTLRGADRGIEVFSTWGSATPTFTDLLIEDMTEFGFYVIGGAQDYHHWGYADPRLSNVTIAGCASGLRLQASAPVWGGGPRAEATLEDCTVRDCTGDGVSITSYYTGGAILSLSRTRVVGNAGNGVAGGSAVLNTPTVISVIASDSLIAGNGDAGIRVTGPGYGGTSTLVIETRQSTVANNATAGIVIAPSYPSHPGTRMEVWNSIVSGNGDDLAVIPPGAPVGDIIFGHWSNSGDGDLLGDEGCIAADPLFVNPALGDYRLKFGSPCIDTATPEFMIPLDLFGHTRPFDGDLDTIELPDMGAMEFAPLSFVGSASAKLPILLELSGPSSGRAIVYLSGSPLSKRPETTPFGSLFLAPGTAFVVPYLTLKSSSPSVLLIKLNRVAIPLGSSVSFQALIKSRAAPAGAAYSNPLELQLAP